MKNNRYLNMSYAVECPNSRINGSSSDVERNTTGFDNISFTKKINGKPYISPYCEKKGMKRYMSDEGFEISEYKKNGKKITIEAHPQKYINENIFGFMRADKEEITEEEYNILDENVKKLYKKSKNKYERNVTKKRKGNFALNGMIGVTRGSVNKEYGICKAVNESMPYVLETYSDMLVGLGNLNINEVGKFTISDIESEFRDYSEDEAKILNIQEELPKEEKFKRIEVALRSLEYLSINSNQSNYLTDTMPKIVILGEYKWGNNMFQGLINKDGINTEGLKEIIEEYDEFRNSNIYIGISNRIMNENFQGLKEKLQEELGEYDFIKISGVKKAFDGYLDYLKRTL